VLLTSTTNWLKGEAPYREFATAARWDSKIRLLILLPAKTTETSLQTISARALAIGTIIVALSMNAWSQNSSAASAPASAAAGSATEASGATAPGKGKKADRVLRRNVYAAIGKHKEISAGSISVTAKDGAVTLNGTVPDATQIISVAEIAKGVPKVTSVTNKLTVRKPFGGM
jgi:osmotically-inducible protein OsmY